MAFKAQHQISQKLGETARVNAMAYGGILLLTGDVPTDEAKNQATAMARGVENVKQVVNQLTVGPIASLGVRSNDTWLTSKVKTALINTKYVPSGTIAVTTDHSVVYLMGKLTQAEGDYAANAAADVGGVAKVVKLFETISREEAVRLSGSGSKSSQSGSSADAKAPIEQRRRPGRRQRLRRRQQRRAGHTDQVTLYSTRPSDEKSPSSPDLPGGRRHRRLSLLRPAQTAPDVRFTTLEGKSFSMQDLRGKVVLVKFWATSCVTCVKQMPETISAYNEYAAKGYEAIAVAMNYDPPNFVLNFAETRKLPFPVALDTKGDIARAFGDIRLTPTAFLIDKQGRIIKRYLGEYDVAEFHATVEKALAAG